MRQTLSLASCLFGVIVVTFVLSIKSLHDDDNPRQSAIHDDHMITTFQPESHKLATFKQKSTRVKRS
jgi:hypothetical protein